jgi:hypothetical protein
VPILKTARYARKEQDHGNGEGSRTISLMALASHEH